jgi:hypothetical protein
VHVCYPALCNWHVQFLASWVFGRTLRQAVGDANDLAFDPHSSPAPRFDDDSRIFILSPDNLHVDYVPFRPEYCLAIYGYGDLKFNEFNHAADFKERH